ncbi:MAG: hypothetical protein U0841_02420 [Chloroflexia bacterium]
MLEEGGQPYTVQYFERTRLEYHPRERRRAVRGAARPVRAAHHPADPPGMPDSTMVWFTETGHNVPNDFYGFWSANGGLAQFGYPISEVITEKLGDGNTWSSTSSAPAWSATRRMSRPTTSCSGSSGASCWRR